MREEAFVNGYAYFLLLLMYLMYFCVFFMRVNEGRVLSKCSSEYYIIGIRTAQRCIETVKFFFVKGQCYKMAIFI